PFFDALGEPTARETALRNDQMFQSSERRSVIRRGIIWLASRSSAAQLCTQRIRPIHRAKVPRLRERTCQCQDLRLPRLIEGRLVIEARQRGKLPCISRAQGSSPRDQGTRGPGAPLPRATARWHQIRPYTVAQLVSHRARSHREKRVHPARSRSCPVYRARRPEGECGRKHRDSSLAPNRLPRKREAL